MARNKEIVSQYRKSNTEALKGLLQEAKDVPCADCNRRYPYWVMHFDHRPGEVKLFGLASVSKVKRGFITVLLEIKKCDVVCANCHAYRTNRRMNA